MTGILLRGYWGKALLAPIFFFLSPFVLPAAEGPAKRSPDEVLLVCNENSPISVAVAADYAARRGIRQRIAIRCVDSAVDTRNETIPLAVYEEAIEKPITAYLAAHPGIQFMVLTKGVPLRIRGAATGVRGVDSAKETPLSASLDNQLAALGYAALPGARKLRITGSGATGFGWVNRYWNAQEPFSHEKFGGYLVTRLDGYTEADAKGLASRAGEAEQHAPAGKVLLDVQPSFGLGDKSQEPRRLEGEVIKDESAWSEFNADMCHAADVLKERGIPHEIDLKEEFIGARHGLTGYFSWGSNDAKFSQRAYSSLTFAPGSIGDTAVSTSARTFLPTTGGQSLIADLIAHGLTCAKGYTDEPLLQAIASPTVVVDLYFKGYTMAESFSAASHFVGWEDVMIGDPLCAPYLRPAGGAESKPPGAPVQR